jgi:ABC-2 type transport system ATP-binding protein
MGINFIADKDMRPTVFDFAHDNGIKHYNSTRKKKILKLFLERLQNKKAVIVLKKRPVNH